MHVREVKPEDLETLGRIAYATGFFGSSAEAFFPSAGLFRDLWVWPYVAGAGCCGFIAENEGQEPLGYILGTCDLRRYQSWIVTHLPHLLLRAAGGQYSGLGRSLPYLLRMTRYPSHLASPEVYPAQLHINLLPQSRGLGLGNRLMETYLDCLAGKNVAGVQLSTTRENTAAIGLYQKFGFAILSEYKSALWRPWLGRDTQHLVMGLRLNQPVEPQKRSTSSGER
ncbi:MAG: GNAT family N-acetyltransferase [Meiothermus sp.]